MEGELVDIAMGKVLVRWGELGINSWSKRISYYNLWRKMMRSYWMDDQKKIPENEVVNYELLVFLVVMNMLTVGWSFY